jgi:uncharacterized FlaG/YvyC family protein
MDSLKTGSISQKVVSSATGTGAAVADAQAVKRVTDGSTERPPEQGSESSRASEKVVQILGARDSSQDRLQVSIDKNDGVVVKIVDAHGNTVRQVPPEELVALARRMDEMIGLLFDKKA